MTYFPDLAESSMVDAGSHVRAIGWLDGEHPFPQGDAPAEFVRKLTKLVDKCSESIQALGWGIFMGCHTCELCQNFRSSLNLGVPDGELLFVAPQMICHYVVQHRYLPPASFIEAVLASPIPGTTEYTHLVKPFYDLHRGYDEQLLARMYERAAELAIANGASHPAIKNATLSIFGNDCDEYCSRVSTVIAEMTG